MNLGFQQKPSQTGCVSFHTSLPPGKDGSRLSGSSSAATALQIQLNAVKEDAAKHFETDASVTAALVVLGSQGLEKIHMIR